MINLSYRNCVEGSVNSEPILFHLCVVEAKVKHLLLSSIASVFIINELAVSLILKVKSVQLENVSFYFCMV